MTTFRRTVRHTITVTIPTSLGGSIMNVPRHFIASVTFLIANNRITQQLQIATPCVCHRISRTFHWRVRSDNLVDVSTIRFWLDENLSERYILFPPMVLLLPEVTKSFSIAAMSLVYRTGPCSNESWSRYEHELLDPIVCQGSKVVEENRKLLSRPNQRG